MGQVFAFVNMKGGVGKTTASVMFAETLASRGRKVLFVDLDAQASATYAIAGFDGLLGASTANRNLCGFLADAVAKKDPVGLDAYISREASTLSDCKGLDLVASHPDLRMTERGYLRHALKSTRVFTPIEKSLQEARRPLFDEIRSRAGAYDAVVVDCPPGVSLFVEAGVFAADLIICPTAPEPLATLGLETIVGRFYRSEWFLNELVALGRAAPPFRVLFSRVDPGAARHRKEIERVERLIEGQDWKEADIAILEEEIENSPVLAGAFVDPDLGTTFADRYGVLARRAEQIAGAILAVPARRAAA